MRRLARPQNIVRTATRTIFGLLACAVVVGGAGAGCSQCAKGGVGGGATATRDDLSVVPRESNFVAHLNIKKLRPTPVWKRFTDMTEQSPEQKAKYTELVQKTGLDPFKQIDSVFLALPAAGQGGDFAAILRGGPFDEARIIAYVKSQLKGEGDVVQSDYNGHKRYTDHVGGTTYACFLDKSTILFGSDAWSKKMIDVIGKTGAEAQAQTATGNGELMALVKKTHTDDAVWGAGIVPPEARTRLAQNDQLKSAGSMKDVYLSADFAGGLKFTAAIDLGSDADANDMSTRLKDQITQSRQNPQVQMMGFGRYFDAIKVQAQGPALHIDIKLDQTGLDDLIERAAGLLKTLGNSFGGGAPSMGAPPPGNPMGAPPLGNPMGGAPPPAPAQ